MAGDADVLLLLRRLKAMAAAGVPLADGVRDLAGGASSERLGRMAERISSRLDEGERIEDALESVVGPDRAVDLRIASRMCGDISDCIGLLAGLIELDTKFRAELRSVSFYPLFILFCLTASLVTIASYARLGWLPLFELFDVDLEAGTRFLLGLGGRPVVAFGVWAVILTACFVASRRGAGRGPWSLLRRLVPGLRRMTVLEARARLCRALRLMISAGVPLSEGADLLRRLCPEAVDQKAVAGFKEGESFWKALRGSEAVDEPLRDLLAAGEKAGALPAVLAQVEKLSLDELSSGRTRFVYAAGFVFIGAVGTIVGVSYYLLMSPYFRLFAR